MYAVATSAMPKRKHTDNGDQSGDVTKLQKNSLDSDEDDNDSDEDAYRLEDDDIEGQEDGVVGQEEGITITPFNMKEELEEGHFDNDGMYHWKKENVAKDNWLDNIDWVKVKKSEGSSEEKVPNEGEDDEDEPESVNETEMYKEILTYMQPKETVAKALKRLGGNKSLSASERLKLKKAGMPVNTIDSDEKVSALTGLANAILTNSGNMDIYQETYEKIQQKAKVLAKATAEPELDMYAEDFEDREKDRLADTSANDDKEVAEETQSNEVMWEYKKGENDEKIKGPFTSAQMEKLSKSGQFGSGVLVRKIGSEQFYTSNRMDFDLFL
ncbi:GYF domain [Nesidiocoris tenuis]|uniref:GYF domain n=1 Tax=Nesidiocoris tenuis TaxID=355587 RepID=A0ABN7AS68_9HEMI|nr:GYF domain [Nesidiocoris tenuis]